MSPDRRCSTAADLELALGDPLDDDLPGSFLSAVTTDRESRFPYDLCQVVVEWGFAEQLLPAEVGGQLESLEACFALSRVLSRRDLTAAISFGASTLASLPVWLRGTPEQKEQIAAVLRSGGALAFALSERDHGADVAASEVKAHEGVGGDWRITGTKWLINNAGHAAGMTVTVRTGPGLRGLTMFFLQKSGFGPQQWAALPKIRTHGVRGSAFGGVELEDLAVTGDAIVGRRGEGMEIALKTLQITRVLVASLALGALDTCLGATLSFARTRQLYGAAIGDLEPVKRRLVDAYTGLLISETVAVTACRAAHLCPDQLPLMSACVKYLVPQLANDSIESLGVVLGARSYLTGEHWHGIFDKMRRDCAVTSLFDGSVPVNLSSIVNQLPALGLARRRGGVTTPSPLLFGRRPPKMPWLNEAEFELATDQDTMHSGVVTAQQVIEDDGAFGEHRAALLNLLGFFRSESERLDTEIEHRLGDHDWNRSGAAYDLAARYCHLHAAGACAFTWLSRRCDTSEKFVTSGAWLLLCLRHLAARIGVEPPPFDGLDQTALDRLYRAFDQHRSFSESDLDNPHTTKEN